ncbi:1,2-phenylacetyl-CoA epoxidase subunit PaaC [Rossellomorea marisflavi]|uniref:1,2-phenylacetyl-CoA epoxidase subunit PaaC n=1 Tax=Rossellomorea marisflavi TaxID=189381 RepID=UPI00345B480D
MKQYELNTIPDEGYRQALASLLYQLADDDFILAYRGSEWLGLAPHIEEDVAFSSINQDTMGHASMIYELLASLGEGTEDELAHGRPPEERRNAIILEEVNGPGDYLIEPRYDWAFAVVRHYFYTVAKKVRMDSLKQSSYGPLAEAAVKINTELYYHLLHWQTWFTQLMNAGGEAKQRMEDAVSRVCEDFQGVLTLGPDGESMSRYGLIEEEAILASRWTEALKKPFDSTGVQHPPVIRSLRGDGRKGEHTGDLTDALHTLSEVYRLEASGTW